MADQLSRRDPAASGTFTARWFSLGLAGLLAAPVATLGVGPAGAQTLPSAGYESPTLRRLEEIDRQERERKRAEDSKWWSFPRPRSAGQVPAREGSVEWYRNLITSGIGKGNKCEFYWPGWRTVGFPVGTQGTDVRNCFRGDWLVDKIAVDCRNLRLSWGMSFIPRGSENRIVKWDEGTRPSLSTKEGREDAQMMAEVCDRGGIDVESELARPVLTPPSHTAISSNRNMESSGAARVADEPGKAGTMRLVNVGVMGQRILDVLARMGVKSVIPTKCPQPDAIAAYSRHDNLLIMCSAAFRDPALATEAIAHEAVHALQDCLGPGGIKTPSSVTLSNYFASLNGSNGATPFKEILRSGLEGRPKTNAELLELKSSLTTDQHQMEYEAYALEVQPKLVMALLLKHGLKRCAVAA